MGPRRWGGRGRSPAGRPGPGRPPGIWGPVPPLAPPLPLYPPTYAPPPPPESSPLQSWAPRQPGTVPGSLPSAGGRVGRAAEAPRTWPGTLGASKTRGREAGCPKGLAPASEPPPGDAWSFTDVARVQALPVIPVRWCPSASELWLCLQPKQVKGSCLRAAHHPRDVLGPA
ncbi:splicing factor, proline- and glutamine-rich-like isoform X1 [Elephas maximus indicus]|uniref:splicing factor, proline- and glutamine-rich-like isoform X1 n=1 Tax=Elephas maximus indicus TaxID=99487 RepID=UPI0021163AA6|nr:splicing factor, proline- and glutamine-rich-like isoform X1 [Elephas maximus indicus]